MNLETKSDPEAFLREGLLKLARLLEDSKSSLRRLSPVDNPQLLRATGATSPSRQQSVLRQARYSHQSKSPVRSASLGGLRGHATHCERNGGNVAR